SNRRIQTPKDVVKEGDVVPVKLVRIEKDRHRLGLSLRQARNDAEAMGFAFDHDGRVIDYPDDVRAEYDLPAPTEEQVARQQQQPRNASEAIEQAVARDHEPVSAMAHAFAQAFEIAGDSPTEETPEAPAAVEEPAEQAVAEVEIATEPVAETLSEEAAAETEDSVPETENKVDAGETPAPATEDTTEADGADNADPVGEDKPDDA
ncbi:MAG: S1 RNA-binding domain-containing protein, partial [Dehalococcoidia bacterium]|nr:S1 RNA-binding domain-containing protein [Dehalococcoidia bacterium]